MKREPFDQIISVHAPPPPTSQAACTEMISIKRFVDLVGCTHALSSHPLMMHLPGEIELDESTDARRVVLARSSRAATSRGNGSRGGVSRSIVRMVRDHVRGITRATFSKPHHPDWVSLEAPPSPRKNRPPRTSLKPTLARAEVTSLEKVLLIGCARLWAATATSGTRGACVVSADQAPRRAGSMGARGSGLFNGVTQNTSRFACSLHFA